MANLDELDYGVLHLLQEDARGQTPVDMAKQLPVSDQTIRNRIEKLEEQGVIEGYVPVINYEKAGFPIRLKYTCTAPVQDREALAKKVLQIRNMVRVEEMYSAKGNLCALAVTKESENINQITAELDSLGLTVESERLLRYEHIRPFNHFGEDTVADD